MVLAAIESGECLQKTICLFGAQLGSSPKGKFAVSIVDKLAPQSVQKNEYFKTLKNSLQDNSYCSRFKCRTNEATTYHVVPSNN